MVYQNVHRLTGQFVELDNGSLTHTENLLNKLPGTTELDGHFHVHVHEQADVALLPLDAL